MLLSQQGSGIGGAERVAFSSLAKATGLDVTVVAPAAQCRFAERLGLTAIEMELPKLRSPAIGPFRLAAGSFEVARLARRLKVRVVYANAIRAMGYALGAKLLGGPPVLAHQHHMLSAEDKHGIGGGIFNRKAFIRSLETWADLIVVPSAAAARPFKEAGKVRVIPNGIDLRLFTPAPDRKLAKTNLGLPDEYLVVGTVTRADPDKGMKAFLSLAERISAADSRVRFLLGGGASFPHEREHYDRVVEHAKRTLGDKLVLSGYMESPVRAYHAMDLMLHTSDQAETLPTTALEAMACGLPVVAYRWGGLSEVLDDESGFLVPPLDEASAVSAVLRLLGDSDLRSAMGRAGRMRCLTHYRLEVFAERMSESIASVAR